MNNNQSTKQLSSNQLLRRLIRDLSQHGVRLTIAIVLTIAQVLLTIYLPILIGQAINQVIGVDQVNFEQLKQILMQMGLVIAFNVGLQYALPVLYNQIVYRTINRLRNQVQSKIQRLPLNYIDTHSTGDIVSRVTTDTDQLADGLLMVFEQFFVGVLTIALTIFTMARLDLTMMLLVVLLTPLSFFVSRFITKRSYRMFTLQTQTRGDHTQLISESIQNNEIIRLYNYQTEMDEKFKPINQQYYHQSKWALFYSSLINPSTRFVNATIYALLAFSGASRIIAGTFTVGELTTFLNYANQYMKPFNDISNVLSEIQSALACAQRMYQLIDQPNEKETGELTIDAQSVKGKIEFDNVSFSYLPDKPLIQDFNLTVHPGQTVAIVGPTGAGKSTLINLLMRFYDPQSGTIKLDGVSIQEYRRHEIRKQFGMVLQETWIKTGTIRDNIAYGFPEADDETIIKAAKAAHADDFIQKLPDGYDTYLTDNGANLSTGQRQLIAIAHIFVSIPQMLILDEATSSIDTRTEVLIQSAFERLMTGRTSFIIAHRLSTIQNADVILVMKDGSIVENGNHHELMAKKGFYYQMQTSGVE